MINKRLSLGTSTAVVLAIVVLLLLNRYSAFDGHIVIGPVIRILLINLALPMILYVAFVLGESGHWSLAVFIFFLMLSGLLWGIITERVIFLCKKKATSDPRPGGRGGCTRRAGDGSDS